MYVEEGLVLCKLCSGGGRVMISKEGAISTQDYPALVGTLCQIVLSDRLLNTLVIFRS